MKLVLKETHMIHKPADLSKIKVIECLYHRTFMKVPYPVLNVTLDGENKEFYIRYRAAKKDKIYHKEGLPCTLIMYDDVVLAYELHNENSVANSRKNIINLKDMIAHGTINPDGWYFDEEKFYRLNAEFQNEFVAHSNTTVLDPTHLTNSETIFTIENSCFVVSYKEKVILQTPPISTDLSWKLDQIGLKKNDNAAMYVNLNYLLKICDVVSKIYGPEEIEKFDISQYMIRHKTVNLRKLPKNVLDNSTTYLTPLEAISYLCGILYKEENFENCMQIVKCLKQVVRSGIVNAKHSDSDNVYLSEIELHDISTLIN